MMSMKIPSCLRCFFSLLWKEAMIPHVLAVYCTYTKIVFSPLQVKNKPCDRESEHAFILGSMVCMVTNRSSDGLYIFPVASSILNLIKCKHVVLRKCTGNAKAHWKMRQKVLGDLHSRVQWFFKLTTLHIVLDRPKISKSILEKGFFFILWCFYLFLVFVLINFKISSSNKWIFF